ncbi:hypothetical protein SDC9_110195 [bioreactor metagenome]|uniref:Uncharacterized protein n=1 Tax=bioreactor metagenome TaxID=1076179 RepID=A0A645BCY8_9ZZZZ
MAIKHVLRRNRHIVEEAEPHGLVARGVVSGWTHAAEGVFQLAGHHRVSGCYRRARRAQSGSPRVGIHGSVGVDLLIRRTSGELFLCHPVGHAAHRGDIHAIMRKFYVSEGGQWRFVSLQRVGHTGHQQAIFDGVQSCRALGVAGAHLVLPAIPVGENSRLAHCHLCVSSIFRITSGYARTAQDQITFGSA